MQLEKNGWTLAVLLVLSQVAVMVIVGYSLALAGLTGRTPVLGALVAGAVTGGLLRAKFASGMGFRSDGRFPKL